MIVECVEDLDVWNDIPECDIPESSYKDDYRNHCDDDSPWGISI